VRLLSPPQNKSGLSSNPDSACLAQAWGLLELQRCGGAGSEGLLHGVEGDRGVGGRVGLGLRE